MTTLLHGRRFGYLIPSSILTLEGVRWHSGDDLFDLDDIELQADRQGALHRFHRDDDLLCRELLKRRIAQIDAELVRRRTRKSAPADSDPAVLVWSKRTRSRGAPPTATTSQDSRGPVMTERGGRRHG